MPTLRAAAFLFALAFTLLALPAEARERRAFIVGVSEYVDKDLEDLANPVNDANGYADVLEKKLGFKVTKLVNNPTQADILDSFEAFLKEIEPGDEIAFIYSGHGWSDAYENYLLPSDAPLGGSEAMLSTRSVKFSQQILDKLQARDPSLIFAVVDACRNSPFDGNRALDRGLVRVPVKAGQVVIYSASGRQKARDRLAKGDPSPYSVFTRSLLPKLADPTLPLVPALESVRDEVTLLAASINHDQRPDMMDDLPRDWCFAGECRSIEPVRDADFDLFVEVTSETGPQACLGYDRYLDIQQSGKFRPLVQKLADICRNPGTLAAAATTLPGAPASSGARSTGLPPVPAPLKPFRDCDGCPEMMVLPAGEFLMGSDTEVPAAADEPVAMSSLPRHKVTLASFAIGVTEVTVDQWELCVDEGDCGDIEFPDEYFGLGTQPVMRISWNEAQQFVRWLSSKSGGRTYRLPTEAEWEYAARGGNSDRSYYWNGAPEDACKFGNIRDARYKAERGGKAAALGCDDGFARTSPAASFAANDWGLFDMFGNMSEWLQDCKSPDYRNAPVDGSADETADCSKRAVRGGSWNGRPEWIWVARRDNDAAPDHRASNMGLRVVAEIK